jgi:hypothetical protein
MKDMIMIREVNELIDKKQEEIIDSIPYNAWRFFTGEKQLIYFVGKEIGLNDSGDTFDISSREFKECLEYWVAQAGGKVSWKKGSE